MVTRVEEAAQFSASIGRLVLEDPIACNLIEHIIDGIMTGRRSYERCDYWLVLRKSQGQEEKEEEEEVVVGAGIRTFPSGLILTTMADATAFALGEAVGREYEQLPFVRGSTASTRAFHRGYSAASQREMKTEDLDYLYHLRTLIPPAPLPAAHRVVPAGEEHRELLLEWMAQYIIDAGMHLDVAGMVSEFIELGTGRILYVEGDGPVSFGHRSLPLQRPGGPKLCRITTVYTPAQYRNRRYASIITAALVQDIQAEDATPVLIAHSINPASNAVYRKLGFERGEDYLWAIY